MWTDHLGCWYPCKKYCTIRTQPQGELKRRSGRWNYRGPDHRGDIIVDCNITTLFVSSDHGSGTVMFRIQGNLSKTCPLLVYVSIHGALVKPSTRVITFFPVVCISLLHPFPLPRSRVFPTRAHDTSVTLIINGIYTSTYGIYLIITRCPLSPSLAFCFVNIWRRCSSWCKR